MPGKQETDPSIKTRQKKTQIYIGVTLGGFAGEEFSTASVATASICLFVLDLLGVACNAIVGYCCSGPNRSQPLSPILNGLDCTFGVQIHSSGSAALLCSADPIAMALLGPEDLSDIEHKYG